MPKISVIIPVYNTEKYLPRCLDSVLNQTLSDIEVICINDCSPDNCLSILKEYAQRDSRIKLIDFEENKGAAVARNRGIDEAQGEYIGFVDSDDFVDLDFYEKLYKIAIETGADCAKGVLMCCDDKNGCFLNDFYDINHKVRENHINFLYGFTSAIYDINFIKKNNIVFPEKEVNFEDPYFSIKAGLFYKKVEIIDDAFYYYYLNNSNSTTKKKVTEEYAYSQVSVSWNVVDMINESDISLNDYLIIYNFIVDQLINWGKDINLGDRINQIAIRGLFEIYEKCKYKEDCLQYYFREKKRIYKKNIFKQIRANLKESSVNV